MSSNSPAPVQTAGVKHAISPSQLPVHIMSLPLRDLDDKDIELQCGTVLRQGTLVRHTFFGEAIARGVDSWVLLDPVE